MIARMWVVGSAAALTAASIGCTSTHVYEIETAGARGFKWTGRIRVTERTTPEIGPFLTFHDRTAAHAIELVGDHDRSIVVYPSGESAGRHPVACVQNVGAPPDQVLALAMCRAYPAMSTLGGAATQPAPAATQEITDEFERMLNAMTALQQREFGRLSALEAVIAAAQSSAWSETTYELASGLTLKVRCAQNDPTSLVVTIFDVEGKVLHRYGPTALDVREVEARQR